MVDFVADELAAEGHVADGLAEEAGAGNNFGRSGGGRVEEGLLVWFRWIPSGLPSLVNSWRKYGRSQKGRQTEVSSIMDAVWQREPWPLSPGWAF